MASGCSGADGRSLARVSSTAAIRLVTWGNAWLAGQVALDDVVDGVRGPEVAHTFALPDPRSGPPLRSYPDAIAGGDRAPDAPSPDARAPDARSLDAGSLDGGAPHVARGGQPHPALAEALPVALALGQLRRRGARALHLCLPAPGDPLGIVGPPSTTALVVQAGQAVVVDGLGLALVPETVGSGVQWVAVPAHAPAAVPSRAEAEREMSEQLLIAARGLTELGVARWNPGLPAALAAVDPNRGLEQLPPTLDPRRSGLIARAMRMHTALSLALAEDGGARTVSESNRRRELLQPLERAVRRAVVAACAPELAVVD